MQPRKKNAKQTSETARLIFRQVRRAENTRFLRRLPGFTLDCELPNRLRELLGHLQEAEESQRGSAQH